jgi:GxxExxY protein
LDENGIGDIVVAAGLRIHTKLGAGLLESAYEACLLYELGKRGLRVQSQVAMPIRYEEVQLDVGFRLDLLVEERVVVEVKAIEKLLPVHMAQLLSYLKLGDFRLGYLLNFNVPHMRDGIKRVVNRL